MTRGEPDWVDDIRLTVPDGAEHGPRPPGAPTGPAVPLRWCALLAAGALAVTAGAGAALQHRRDQSRTVTVVRYVHPDGVDLNGCPRGDNCVPLEGPGSALTDRLPPELRGARVLAETSLLDSGTSTTVRMIQVLAVGRLTVTVTAQCIAGAPAVPARDLASSGDGSPAIGGSPAVGGSSAPVTAGFVRPGPQPGCSVAVLASAPTGTVLPTGALRRLADDPDLPLTQ